MIIKNSNADEDLGGNWKEKPFLKAMTREIRGNAVNESMFASHLGIQI